MDDVILYDRDPHYVPRVAAVHDMCGYGNCSLTAAIPILSAAGCDVCPVPTALFSAHTRYSVFTFHDTTEILDGYLDAWRKENVDLDGVYSGFLGSAEQVAIIKRMGTLVDGADVLMPNLTEASMLTGRTYPGQNIDNAEVNGIIDALLALGAKNVVLKGVDRQDGIIRNYVASATSGASGKQEIAHDKLPFMTHGTGDAFASALCGAVMAGRPLAESAHIAGEFVRHAMESTQFQPNHTERGVSFELNLDELTRLVRR